MNRIRLAASVLAALLVGGHSAVAQRKSAALVGWLKDSAGVAVAGADVQIEAQDVYTRTDSSGRFRLPSLDPGAVTVRIRRLGYDPHTFDVVLHASGVDSVSVTMQQNATLLDAIRTDASVRRRYSAIEEFYQRRSQGNGGYFMTREELARHHTSRLSEALREVPGVRFARSGSARGGLRFNSANSKRFDCPPQYWVDGRRLRSAEIDDFPVTDIEAMELYSGPATTPVQFAMGTVNTCGTVAIWTRIPGTP